MEGSLDHHHHHQHHSKTNPFIQIQSQQQQSQPMIATVAAMNPASTPNLNSSQQQQPQPAAAPPAPSQQQQQQQGTDSSSSRPHGRGHQPGGATCKECGNQAKKDCQFQRCRTCCKSRSYDCSTHVRSTWVPAAKRRERHALEAAAIAAGQPRPRSKRTRSLALGGGSTSSAAAGASGGGGGGGQVGGGAGMSMSIGGGAASTLLGLPGPSSPRSSTDLPASSYRGVLPPEVRAQALFKCVRVTGIEDGENEYAYQATVKIGGHVFKGVLYDQGVETPSSAAAAASGGGVAAQAAPVAGLADLQLGASRSGSGYLDPSQIYGSSTFLGALR